MKKEQQDKGEKPRTRRCLGLPTVADDLAEDVFVEREIGHDSLELRVLFTQLAELFPRRSFVPFFAYFFFQT